MKTANYCRHVHKCYAAMLVLAALSLFGWIFVVHVIENDLGDRQGKTEIRNGNIQQVLHTTVITAEVKEPEDLRHDVHLNSSVLSNDTFSIQEVPTLNASGLLMSNKSKIANAKSTVNLTTLSKGKESGVLFQGSLKDWVNKVHKVEANNGGLGDGTRAKLCPLWPAELVGPMNVTEDMTLAQVRLRDTQLQGIESGGRHRPQGCLPREKTAIIVPYRDRDIHLEILVNHLHAMLQRQKIEYRIFVIEMAYPTQFNRGLLANVGFLTASSLNTFTCFVFHDVDLVANDDRNMYRCGRVPRHLTASNSKFKSGLPYLAYFGGVQAFTADQFWKTNGFSNMFFGWGGEDDDMVLRILNIKQHFSRPRLSIGGYVALDHKSDTANPVNPNRFSLLRTAADRMTKDGLKAVQYTRIALEFRPLYTWALISVKEAKILEKFQTYLEDTS